MEPIPSGPILYTPTPFLVRVPDSLALGQEAKNHISYQNLKKQKHFPLVSNLTAGLSNGGRSDQVSFAEPSTP